MNNTAKKLLPSIAPPVIRSNAGVSASKIISAQINPQFLYPVFSDNPTHPPFANNDAQ